MAISPQEAAGLSPGETLMANSFISALDAKLIQHYDDSGKFDMTFEPRAGLSVKIGSFIVRQYKLKGWRGSWFTLDNAGLTIHLNVEDRSAD